MHRYVCILIALLCAIATSAQPQISGTIADSARKPLQYCTVALLSGADRKVVKGTITDDAGKFSIAVPTAGTYMIQVHSAGYADYISNPIPVDSATRSDLGIIVLKTANNVLGEVAVKANRSVIEFRNGVIILNVENDVLATGNTVLELLKRLPGVTVDAQNNVTVDGQGGIGFMIDGRLQQIPAPQMINMLSSMSAESVSTIELIKNPSAKYDAAGTSGLINITLKKVKMRGISGNIFESAGYGKRMGSVSAFSLNYKTRKLTLFSNTTYTNKDVLTENTMNRTLSTTAGNTYISANGRSESLQSVLNFRGGVEYEPTDNTTIGLNITNGPNTSNEFTGFNTSVSGIDPFTYNYLRNAAYNPEHYNNPSASAYIQHVFDTTGTQLRFSTDYTWLFDRYSGTNRNYFFEDQTEVQPMQAYNNVIDLDFRIFTQKLDFTKVLNKTTTLEAGEKTSFVENNNNSSVAMNIPGTESYHTDTQYTSRYDYKEQILAGYVNLTKSMQKGSVQIGVRGEQTNVNAVNKADQYHLTKHYFDLFPNLGAEYAIDQKNSLQFSYGYRIDRPAYFQLNPVRIFSDQLNYASGNPELKPQYSHKISLELNHNNLYHLSVNYVHTYNSIYNYSFTRPGSQVSTDTTFNFSSSDHVTLVFFAQKQLAKWYNMQVSVNCMYGNRSGIIDGVSTKNETVAMQASMNNFIDLPGGYRLQVNAGYTTPYKDGIQKYNEYSNIDVALQKKFFRGKLSVTFGVYDIFYASNGSFTNVLPGQYYYISQRMDTRRLRLNLNYRFGNMKIARKVDNTEDNDRTRKGK